MSVISLEADVAGFIRQFITDFNQDITYSTVVATDGNQPELTPEEVLALFVLVEKYFPNYSIDGVLALIDKYIKKLQDISQILLVGNCRALIDKYAQDKIILF